MKNIYDIEGTILQPRYMKKFFLFCLVRDYKLLKYCGLHILSYLAYVFHLHTKTVYYKNYWKFIEAIDFEAMTTAFYKKCTSLNDRVEDEHGIYYCYAPKAFIASMRIDQDVIALEELTESPHALADALKKRGVSAYASVEGTDRNFEKTAQKQYFLKKGRLVERTRHTSFLRVLKIIALLALFSLIITEFVLMLTPLEWQLGLLLCVHPLIVFVNFVPVFCAMLILYGLSNSIRFSFTLSSVFFFILVEINRFKMAFRDDPFVFTDIKYAKEAAQMTNNYTLFIDKITALVLLMMLIVILYLGYQKLQKTTSRIARLCMIAIPILSFPSLYKTVYLNENLYSVMWMDSFGNQWKEGNQYIARGFNYSFLRSYASGRVYEPDDYDQASAQAILDSYSQIDMQEHEKINLIGIMLEAYNDFSVLSPTAEIDPSVYQNMHKIQAEGYAGFLYTDIFAGGTIASERSFLSGYSSLGEFRKPTNSYVDFFKQQGYYTEAMHPCYGWFYNRKTINEIGFGFDSFDYYENTYEEMIERGDFNDTFFGFLTDMDFFEQIILGYEANKERDMPYFNFSVTYQNHGPYSSESTVENEYLKWQDGYNEADYNIVNNYLANVKATDEAIGMLYEYIYMEEDPIVLIMFGDHNPYLGEGNSGFEMLDINLDLGTEEGGCNYYQTPYVIVANQAAKDALGSDIKGEGDTISPMFLMNEFFEAANLEIGSPYSQYLKDLKKEIDVINQVYIKEDGRYILYNTFEDTGILKEFYDVQFLEQYGYEY